MTVAKEEIYRENQITTTEASNSNCNIYEDGTLDSLENMVYSDVVDCDNKGIECNNNDREDSYHGNSVQGSSDSINGYNENDDNARNKVRSDVDEKNAINSSIPSANISSNNSGSLLMNEDINNNAINSSIPSANISSNNSGSLLMDEGINNNAINSSIPSANISSNNSKGSNPVFLYFVTKGIYHYKFGYSTREKKHFISRYHSHVGEFSFLQYDIVHENNSIALKLARAIELEFKHINMRHRTYSNLEFFHKKDYKKKDLLPTYRKCLVSLIRKHLQIEVRTNSIHNVLIYLVNVSER
jgi:hypothetical protein